MALPCMVVQMKRHLLHVMLLVLTKGQHLLHVMLVVLVRGQHSAPAALLGPASSAAGALPSAPPPTTGASAPGGPSGAAPSAASLWCRCCSACHLARTASCSRLSARSAALAGRALAASAVYARSTCCDALRSAQASAFGYEATSHDAAEAPPWCILQRAGLVPLACQNASLRALNKSASEGLL